jgi:uncharacterized protein (DUF2147 family)
MRSSEMRTVGLGLILLAGLFVGSSPTASADDNKGVFGYWKNVHEKSGKTQSIFRVWEDKGKLVGKIIKTFDVPGEAAQDKCTECAGAQKDKPVQGLIFFWGFERDKENPRKWVDGKILNPRDGKTYSCEAELSEDGKTLNVYGYIRIVVKVGGTSVWQRPSGDEMRGIAN